MTKEQLAELRKLAEVATDGPWVSAGPSFDGSPVYDNEVVVENPDSNRHEYQICSSSRPQSPSDMEYIAAFNPVTAVALLDRIAELEKEAAELRLHVGLSTDLVAHFLSVMQAATISAKDGDHKKGMDWIMSHLNKAGSMPCDNTETAAQFFDRQVAEQRAFTKARCSAE